MVWLYEHTVCAGGGAVTYYALTQHEAAQLAANGFKRGSGQGQDYMGRATVPWVREDTPAARTTALRIAQGG